MKKIGILLLSLGLILLLVAALYPKDKEKNGLINNNPEWVIVKGSTFDVNYPSYDTDDLIIDYFNSTNSDNNDKYLFAISKENKLHMPSSYYIQYTGPFMVTYSSNEEITDFNKFLENDYIIEKKDFYNKINISKMVISDNMIVASGKYFNEEKNIFVEELTIYYGNNNEYSHVNYQIINQTFSEQFIKKLIDSFKVESNKAVYTSCKENGNIYNCEMNVISLGKKIKFNVNSTKYKENDDISLKNSTFINNYTSRFKAVSGSNITVSLVLSSSIENDINNVGMFSSFTESKVTLNGKSISKYYLKTSEKDMAYYISELTDNVYIMLNVRDENNQLDEIARDFMNYEIVNIK